MSGLARLAWRQARHATGRSALLVGAVAVSLFVPLASQVLTVRFDRALRARAASTPLVVGAAGSRFDLTLEALFFRRADRPAVSRELADQLRADGRALVVPLHLDHTVRKRPLVGTSPEYFEQRGLACGAGTLPLFVGDLTLGALAAEALGLGVGDRVYSDPPKLYDLSQPAAMELVIVGVLRPTGTPDDGVAFADLRTAWALDGHLHGHAAAEELAAADPELVIGAAEGRVALSGALIEERRFDAEQRERFHYHGDEARLPLSALLLFPADEEARTILKARINGRRTEQALRPEQVVEDLLAVVFRVKALLDRIAVLLGVSTAALVALVAALSLRVRARELRTLDLLGAPRGFVARLVLLELGLVLALGAALAGAGAALVGALVPDLVTLL